MPLSPNVQRIANALTVPGEFAVPEGATDDHALALSADRLAKLEDGLREQDKEFQQQATQVETLSADVTRLTGELTAAQQAAKDAKATALQLSADVPQPLHPQVAASFAEAIDLNFEEAVRLGAPKNAAKAFAALLKAPDGKPSVLALSACSVPAAEGKYRDGTYGIEASKFFRDLWAGKYGTGVPLGVTPGTEPVLQASGDGNPKPALELSGDPVDVAKREWAANADDCRTGFVNESAYVGWRKSDLRQKRA